MGRVYRRLPAFTGKWGPGCYLFVGRQVTNRPRFFPAAGIRSAQTQPVPVTSASGRKETWQLSLSSDRLLVVATGLIASNAPDESYPLPMAIEFRNDLTANPSHEMSTQRLLLRPVRVEDAGPIFESFTAEITRYMRPAPPRDLSESEAFVDRALAAHAKGTDLHWAIENRETEEFLGLCGLHGGNHRVGLELGIWVKKDAHGAHYGREAVEAVARWVSAYVACDYLIYPVDKRNAASRKIPERLGGEIIGERTLQNGSGSVLDEIIYRIPLISTSD